MPQILSGWKDVANYLGKGVRTVQRYERELALPVRRPGGKSRGSIIATRAELDAWIAAIPVRDTLELEPRKRSEPSALIGAVRTSLAEMHKLREQMETLRLQMQSSLFVLSRSIRQISERKPAWPNITPEGGDRFFQSYGLLGHPASPPNWAEDAPKPVPTGDRQRGLILQGRTSLTGVPNL